MKLRPLVRQISNPEQLVPDFRCSVNLLAGLVECFNAVANGGQRFGNVSLDHAVFRLHRLRLVFQQRIAHPGVSRNVLADGAEDSTRRQLETEIQSELFRELGHDHPVGFRLVNGRNRLSHSLDQSVVVRECAVLFGVRRCRQNDIRRRCRLGLE